MLSKSKRLNLKTSFRWVASGKTYNSKNFKVFYRLGENENPRVAVSISSSYFKKSHDRNKAKRIMFLLAQNEYYQLHKSINLVIMPKAQVLEIPIKELEFEFKHALSSLKIN